MLPIYNEYNNFIKDKFNIFLENNKYWYDDNYIKGFDKDGNIHLIYRLYFDSFKCDKIDNIEVITHKELINININILLRKEKDTLNLITNKLKNYEDYTPIVLVDYSKETVLYSYLVNKIIPNVQILYKDSLANSFYIDKEFNIPKNITSNKYLLFASIHLFMDSVLNKNNIVDNEFINKAKWGVRSKCRGIVFDDWTELDIWLYILMNNIEVNNKYKQGYDSLFFSKNKRIDELNKYFYKEEREQYINFLRDDFINNELWLYYNCTIEDYINKYTYKNDIPTDKVIEEFMQYKGIKDKEIAKKYFNNKCSKCGTVINKDEVGLSLKYFGRKTNNIYCFNCLSKYLYRTIGDLKKDVIRFKNNNCNLF